MAKYGLFKGAAEIPSQEADADYIAQIGEYVQLYVTSKNPQVVDSLVAVFHVDKGYSVKKLS